MTRSVRLGALAVADLVALHRWVRAEAGQATADAYLDRIEVRIATLADFPDRGTLRDDLAPGLRTLAFERRLVIAYLVAAETVTVLRVVSGARDLGGVFAG